MLRSFRKRKQLDELLHYFPSFTHHQNYASRLASGRSIGSGQVEGACKSLIGRIKQCGARWKVRRVNRMAGLAAFMYIRNKKTT